MKKNYNYKTIHDLILAGEYKEAQINIDSGLAWLMEGHYGRISMDLLESGACILGKDSHKDYYGNKIPSYKEVAKGTKGSLENAYKFYELDENL